MSEYELSVPDLCDEPLELGKPIASGGCQVYPVIDNETYSLAITDGSQWALRLINPRPIVDQIKQAVTK